MLKKILSLMGCMLISCMLLVSCSGGGSSGSYSGTADVGSYSGSGFSSSAGVDNAMQKSDNSLVADMGGDYDSESDVNVSPEVQEAQKARENVKVIYTGSMELETMTFDASLNAIKVAVSEAGGYIENMNSYSRGESPLDSFTDDGMLLYANIDVKIPAGEFNDFVDKLENDGIGNVTEKDIRAEDVTKDYYDAQTRLEVARNEVTQLQALLAKAETIDEVLRVREQLSQAVYEVESIQGQINYYDDAVAYSSLSIDLSEVTALTMRAHAANYGSKLVESATNGLVDGLTFLGDLLLAILSHWLLLGLFVLIVVLFVRMGIKKSKEAQAKNAEIRAQREREAQAQREEIEQLKQVLAETDEIDDVPNDAADDTSDDAQE